MLTAENIPFSEVYHLPDRAVRWISLLYATVRHWKIANCVLFIVLAFVATQFSLSEAGCLLTIVAIILAILFQFFSVLKTKYDFISTNSYDGVEARLRKQLGVTPSGAQVLDALNEHHKILEDKFGWIQRAQVTVWAWEAVAAITGTFLWGFGERIWPSATSCI